MTSISCGFSLNTHLDEIFRPVFHHMSDLRGEGGKRVNDGPLRIPVFSSNAFVCLFGLFPTTGKQLMYYILSF